MTSGTTQPGFQDAFKEYQDECQNECDIIKFMIMWYLNFRQIKLSSDENRDVLTGVAAAYVTKSGKRAGRYF